MKANTATLAPGPVDEDSFADKTVKERITLDGPMARNREYFVVFDEHP